MIGTVHICTGCSHPDRDRRTTGPSGVDMVAAMRSLIGDAGLADTLGITAYPCLGNCDRNCRISVGGYGRWSWLLGDLAPDALPTGLAAFLTRWAKAPDGFLPKDDRPPQLRRHLIGRVPPTLSR
jgi:predicted metal-binding protein